MLFHPHAHLLVSAGGFCPATQSWVAPKHPAFLVPVRALSVIFRAKNSDAVQDAKLLDQSSGEGLDPTLGRSLPARG